jgi:tRNA-dependent cyclodipeptide synthase
MTPTWGKETSISEVLAFLDSRNIRYKICHFSTSHTAEQTESEISRLGLGLLQAIPLEAPGKDLMVAVIPSGLAVQPAEFAKLLEVRAIATPGRDEIRRRYPSLDLTSGMFLLTGLPNAEIFLSPLIARHRTVGFFFDSTKTLLTMDTTEFRRVLGNLSPVSVPTRQRYRAYATPGRKPNQHSILGVSLESAAFRTAKLVTITEWVRNHYPRCTVMLGDGLYRLTLQLESDSPENEALEYSKWLARDYVQTQWPVFHLRESECQFDFRFCSDVLTNDPCYPAYYAQVCSLFAGNASFQESCKAFARDFIRRKPDRENDTEKHIDLSIRYLLEELAVISCLAEEGPCTFVYPGSLTILEEIADGKHPDVPAPLRAIDYIQLKLKHRDNGEE